MSSVAKTINYELNQWTGNEYPKRQDFVDDNSIIDAQMKANADAAGAAQSDASTAKGKTDYLSVTQPVDLDTLEEDTTALKSIGDIIEKSVSGNILDTDADRFLKCTNSSSITLTIQPDATIAIAVGAEISVTQYGAGTVSFAAGSGVTIRSIDSALSIDGQYTSVALKKIATDEWLLVGSLA